MKAGILTFHYAYNYGAVLQAYGLQQTLINMGIDTRILDYRAPAIQAHNRPLGIRSGRFMHVIPMRMRFDRFRKDRLLLTRHLKNQEDVENESQSFDAIIVGSDQVWNTNILKGLDLVYYLGFRGNFTRISYAACFGQRKQYDGVSQRMSGLLRNFNYLSVRGEQNREMVTDLINIKPEVVVDPSVLHEYGEIIDPTKKEKQNYILVYSIWPASEQEMLAKIAGELRDRLQYPVVSISQMWDFKSADRHIRNAGPVEWCEAFNNASFICTDSFHGVTFAIKFRKPFFVVANNQRAFRISDFLRRCGLENRLLDKGNCLADISSIDIDYENVYEMLQKDIQTSRAFLKNALNPN